MSHIEPSDADAIRRTLAGEREAFGRLFDRHAPGVRAVVASVSRDFSATEDLTQETFLRAYRRLGTLRDISAFRGWLHGIARMVAKERLKQVIRERRLGEQIVPSRTDAATNQDVVACEAEQRRAMAALAELPGRERLVVHAHFFCEQSAARAAASIGLSRSGFYAALERGLRLLRRRLEAGGTSTIDRRAKR